MKKIFFVLFFLLSIVLFLNYFFVFIPKNSVARVGNKDGIVFIETLDSPFFRLGKSSEVKKYTVGKNFKMSGYFYAGKREEKFLKNDFSFSVMFPDSEISSLDTALIFNQIRAHAYICMQKASGSISQDFYFENTSYPELFKKVLNSGNEEFCNNFYFTDVKISRIAYEEKYSLETITELLFFSTAFLREADLYRGLVKDDQELSYLNDSLLQNFLTGFKFD